VARVLAAFAVRSSTDLILDPSCGDGRLLEEAIRLKACLSSGGNLRPPNPIQEAFGIDRSAAAIRLASRVGASVYVADFFDVGVGSSTRESIKLPAGFDAIIGNPPYIRQELMGPRDKRRISRRLELDRACAPEIFWPRWSGRSDIYVYFFAHSIRLLKPGGRLVFLTASSWLDAGYGAALREFLLKNFRLIAVIEPAAESFFADASINTVITVLERESGRQARDANLVRFVHLTAPLSDLVTGYCLAGHAAGFARAIERAGSSLTTEAQRIRVVRQADLLPAGAQAGGRAGEAGLNKQGAREAEARPASKAGWGKYLRADDVFFKVVERGGPRLCRLSELARVRFGVKTGANEFFYLKPASRDEVKASGAVGPRPSRTSHACMLNAARQKAKSMSLASAESGSARHRSATRANESFNLKPAGRAPSNSAGHDPRRMTLVEDAAGRRFAIESQYLAPVVFSLKEIPGILFSRVESGKLFFDCPLTRADLAGTRALDYIRRGERAGYSLRPTCAARGLWYSVAAGLKPAPMIFPSKVGERWLVALNRAGAFEDKKLYGIFPSKAVSGLLLTALLNSTWARYYAEVTCRQMIGAQAIADIDVAVAEGLMIPDPRVLSPSIKKALESAIVALARRPVHSVFEEVSRADRRRLDRLTLRAIGFADAREREAALNQLYAAVTGLVRARLNKSGKRKA
jgi:SAM-dependent methyltransferase